MNIFVFSEHIRTDPLRSTFYNIDSANAYYKTSVMRILKGKNKLCYYINLLITALICRFKYKRQDIGLVISENPRIGFIVSIINRLTFCDINHTIWHFNTQSIYTGLKLLIVRYACSTVRYIVVHSEYEKNVYSKMLDIPKYKIIINLYSGPYLDDERYIKFDKNNVIKDYIVSAGFSGRDYHFLSLVAAAFPEVTFIIITYPKAIKNISFNSNVKIVSGIPEIEYCRYITNAKLSFLPIKNRATANGHIGIVQAMCFKTPLLTNMTEGTKDYLVPNVNAMIFKGGDVEDAIKCIKRILSDEKYTRKIVENAYKFAQDNFTIKNDINIINRIVNYIAKSEHGI